MLFRGVLFCTNLNAMFSSNVFPKCIQKIPVIHGCQSLEAFLLYFEILQVTTLAQVNEEQNCITYLNLKLYIEV
jgi:hypothetical protein